MLRRLLAEGVGTFILVFAGTGAIVVNQVSGGAVTHPGIALTFGLVVMAMIYAFGETSGAHLNPAVTLGLATAGTFPWRNVPAYVLAQCLGAVGASGFLRLLFPGPTLLGATLPSGSATQSYLFELLLTFILMLVILRLGVAAREKQALAGIIIGGVVGLEAMFAGPICGASMNPARSLGPALVSGHLEHLWIYCTATVGGALLAVPIHRLLQNKVPSPETTA